MNRGESIREALLRVLEVRIASRLGWFVAETRCAILKVPLNQCRRSDVDTVDVIREGWMFAALDEDFDVHNGPLH